ncbi:MAG: glycoside hydrolase family 2 TIM barrel-domain containing protein [Breznakibacter sp.]
MKKGLFIGMWIIMALWGLSVHAQVSFGKSEKFNDDWKFQLGDPKGAGDVGFDDSRWRVLDLPHDWSVEGAYSPGLASATGYLPGGIAWYRKTFDLPQRKDELLFVYFEGIYRNGEVYVNGKLVGKRPNGYISYMYEITPYVDFGRQNEIAVRVDHSQSTDSRWYTGSGIYRDVYLIFANPVHIDQWGVNYHASVGKDGSAKVQVETSLKNTISKATTVNVVQQIINKEGNVIGTQKGSVNLAPNTVGTLAQQLTVFRPQLWSIDSPYLYRLKTVVYHKGKQIDQTITSLGIRTLAFDPDKGFALNGQSMKIKGVCLHHDAGCLGGAVPKEVWRRRLEALKTLGCNAIRTSHNPQAPVLYHLCDEMGFLVLNEAFDEWEFPKKKWVEGWNVGTPVFQGPYEFFEEWGETDLKDMVLRDRNHPSVFMWSIGNEVDYPNDPYSHPILDTEGIAQYHVKGYQRTQPDAMRLGGIAKKLAAVVRKYDLSRPVTAGLAGAVMSNETEYPAALDVVGYNYTEYRYAQDHAKYPHRVFYGSETVHSLDAWKAVKDNDYIFGQFIWTGIDYLGESFAWPSRGFTSGMVDLAGFMKPRGYYRQSLWTTSPMVYLGSYLKTGNSTTASIDALPVWNYAAGDTVRVVCYTNCDDVTLHLNGTAITGSKHFDAKNGIVYWDLPYQKGVLTAKGTVKGKEEALYELKTTGRPHAIRTNVYQGNVVGKDKGVAQIEVTIVDENGLPVPLADDMITCRVKGAGKLLGLEASDPADMGNYSDHEQRVFHGKLVAYVQATGQGGHIEVTLTSPWLQGTSVRLEAK